MTKIQMSLKEALTWLRISLKKGLVENSIEILDDIIQSLEESEQQAKAEEPTNGEC